MIILYIIPASYLKKINLAIINRVKTKLERIERYEQMERIARNLIAMEIY